ncbi:MAG: RdgB/HAM1 family non-canonical purine NTP pyrophosphatase [Verrucomicrobia bacterium]|nr:RdgB/HAM1 family non-canonical purine NTP pyrophosphatase [Verrucomicrobiota bacterium]
MQTLLIATRNSHKTREIREILGPGWDVRDVTTLAHAPEVEETGQTFQDNAVLKATAISEVIITPEMVLADDSGLEVDALNGEPGVRSARYAGPSATDADNRSLLRQKLSGLPAARFSARFRCVMALAREGNVLATVDGAVEGEVIREERGHGGFGYDPMFIPSGYQQTFAELAPAIKNSLSHRARALRKVLELLRRQPT